MERIHQAGAQIVAVSVDSQERNEGMRHRWELPFPFLSDPQGEEFLKPLGLWNAEERGGLAVPALVLFSSGGEEIQRVTSRDYADRIHDEDVLGALEALGFDPISPPATTAAEEPARKLRGAFPSKLFDAYFRGNFYGAIALRGRIADADARREAKAHQLMAQSFLDEWKTRRQLISSNNESQGTQP
ncbi:MAG: redoxin domain-containing protein [Deltaproteobacteria bacterium]|nr:redoxin domain-containing protein [Deltaproteobacteria bacterium]